MSGLTLAAGARSAGASAGEVKEMEGKSREDKSGLIGGLMGSLRIIELQLVAFIVVFSASGLVPLLDIAFPVLITAYLCMLNTFVFKNYGPPKAAKEVFHGSRMFQLYVVLGTVVGLFLPLAYVLGGFARGDQPAVRAATPHLFLVSAQILSENVINSLDMFSPPVRVVLPLLYTGRRLFTLADWVSTTFFRAFLPPEPWIQDVAWLWFGRGLALANLIYFSINFFCFLIPRFLPRAFEHQLKQSNEGLAKQSVPPQAPKKAQ
ncbi:hypothetical protein GOP47_0017528 [Adiantum capillus-veneris]|uniref:DUF7733 domain-containing protein n=1 Tax=Adiantum capillus-veneris TaxID=13818 RepID=A0A9D4ZAV7_ADICA|nr:hypothetical protein GOP47_0017528 [Adiantum capillus-veneris]